MHTTVCEGSVQTSRDLGYISLFDTDFADAHL